MEGADLLLYLTEWPQFADLDPARIARPVLIDGRGSAPQKYFCFTK